MRPAQVLRHASGYLARHDVESPEATAELLLASVLGTDRAGMYARTEGLTSAEAREFGRALCRRCTGVPAQHLTGEQGFRRLTVEVRPGVFVPRPETEVLVEAAIEAVGGAEAPVVVDVGTGTGAVALAVADEVPSARVIATDVSTTAVALARTNAARLGLDVEVLEGDLLSPIDPTMRGSIHCVVSNLPYVSPDEYEGLPPEVRADPALALVGGLRLIARLAASAREWLRPGGTLAVEIGAEQGRAARAILEERFRAVRVLPDLTGRDRVVAGRRP